MVAGGERQPAGSGESEVVGVAGFAKLVERQMAVWEMKRRLVDLGLRSGRHLEGGVAYGPCLLISRECGSGGGRVARLVGERLDWHVFDREILDKIIELADVRVQLCDSVGEQTRIIWGDSWRPEPGAEDLGYDTYLKYLRQVVLTLGHHGDVVLLGRGSQYLLPARSSLRVRVIAPLELRVQRVADCEGLSLPEARRFVEDFDHQRAEFIHKAFHRDGPSPLNYDLVINTGQISVEGAVRLVLLALQEKLGVRPHTH